MKTLVFLVEERSAEALLEILLPSILSSEISWRIIPHEGKQDLERSFPRKLRVWNQPSVQFIIMRDQDSSDCKKLKAHFKKLCEEAGRERESLIRIVCHELESWFLGDLDAVAKAFNLPKIMKQKNKSKFQDPDRLANASQELKKMIPNYQKIQGARLITPHLNLKKNRSTSFQVFLSGIQKLLNE